MNLVDLNFIPLDNSFDLSLFDCTNADINEFLQEDALDYQASGMANTYIFVTDANEIKCFFSISNDCLNDLGYANTIWNRFHRKSKIPNEKRIRHYPAIKIGRLGVNKDLHGTGLAYQLMDFIKGWAAHEAKPACRLLLLDSLNQPKQINYYQRNGFDFLLDDDLMDKNRIMYYDIIRLK